MGATNTAPSQKSGFFLCKSKATAPPMDSPNKYLIFSLFSCFSKIKQKEEEEMIGHTGCFKTVDIYNHKKHVTRRKIKSYHIYL